VPGDRESYLVAIEGRLRVTTHPRLAQKTDPERQRQHESYSVIVLIVDVATGAPTDSGFSNEYPDLRAVGCVVTHRHKKYVGASKGATNRMPSDRKGAVASSPRGTAAAVWGSRARGQLVSGRVGKPGDLRTADGDSRQRSGVRTHLPPQAAFARVP
jgi:hypothetical protein